MAVMASQLLDKAAFEPKALPVPSADLMAVESDLNGQAHDALFDAPHPSDLAPPALNGDHTLDVATPEPAPRVTSGIAPTAPFKPVAPIGTALADPTDSLAVASSSIPPSIEAPISEVRQHNDGANADTDATSSLPMQTSQISDVDDMDTAPEPSTAPTTITTADDSAMGAFGSKNDDTQNMNHTNGADSSHSTPSQSNAERALGMDHDMTDAPPSGKVRAREEDDDGGDDDGDGEPLAKRTKVEGVAADAVTADSGSSALAAPATEAGATTTTTTTTEVSANADATDAAAPSKSSSDPLWPSYDAEPMTPLQQSTLLQRVRNARKIKAAGPFNKAVDPVALNIPNYPLIIKEPMDLQTIENKLKASQYTSVDNFLYDFNLMVRNCYTFNGREHPVAHLAADLERYVTNIFPAALDRKGQASADAKKQKKPVAVAIRKETRRKSLAQAAPPADAISPTVAPAAAPAPPVAPAAPAAPAAQAAQAATTITPNTTTTTTTTTTSTSNANAPTIATNATPAAAPSAPASAVVASPTDRFALQPDGTPVIRRDSTTQDGRPKRQIQRPKPKDLPYSVKPKKKKFELELKFCEQTLNEVRKKQYAKFVYPFLHPVDPVALNVPHYHKIIKKPMDLETIDNKLHRGEYSTSKEFKSDFDLMLANCFKFNPETDEVHQMGVALKELFQQLWNNKDTWIEEHQPQSEPQSASAGEDDDDDEDDSSEDEDEDAQQRDLVAIQQQIAELTSRAQTIIQSGMKRSSPNAKGEKKKKGKAGKGAEKKKKGASASGTAKVAPLKVKKTKVTPLTFAQKQEISETIGTLEENNMRKAVQIIRNGVPSLKSVNDEELEIDMDIIPDDVLRDLYKFLRGTRPKETKAEPSDEEFEPPKRTPKTATKRKNKPMGKKEQEESIRAIQRQLESFKNPGASGDDQSPPAAQHDDSSSDDDGESESEEE